MRSNAQVCPRKNVQSNRRTLRRWLATRFRARLRFGLGARSGGGSLPLTQTETSMTSGGGLGSSMEHAFGLNRKTAMLVSPDSSPSAAPMPASWSKT